MTRTISAAVHAFKAKEASQYAHISNLSVAGTSSRGSAKNRTRPEAPHRPSTPSPTEARACASNGSGWVAGHRQVHVSTPRPGAPCVRMYNEDKPGRDWARATALTYTCAQQAL